MKISLICPCSNLLNYGVRSISSYLKANGHEVDIYYVLIERNNFNGNLFFTNFTLEYLLEWTKDSGLIGMSVMTNFLSYAVKLTSMLKRNQIPIVWGGIHPTVFPKSSLTYTDFVCQGEGEEVLLELVEALEKNKPVKDIKNLWFKENGKIIGNKIRPLIQNLDKLPEPDYDLSNQYIIRNGNFSPLDRQLLKDHMIKMEEKSRYSVFTSRGCPAKCGYCCNDFLKDLYKDKGSFVRKRSIDNVIKEIKEKVEEFGFESVCIQDEDFLVRSHKEIDEFCVKYKREIDLPFQCEFSPRTFDAKKIKKLINSDLCRVQIGIQSFDEETNKTLYNRNTTKYDIRNMLAFFSKFPNVLCNLHFLIHNPWETEKSLLSSIKFCTDLPPNFNIKLYPLVFYPGTSLYRRAMEEGLIGDFYKGVVYKTWGLDRIKDSNYLTLVFYLLNLLRNKRVSNKKIKFIVNCLTVLPVRKVLNLSFIVKPLRNILYFVHQKLGENRV